MLVGNIPNYIIHAVIHAKILTGINRENVAVKNKQIQEREVKDPKLSTPP